MAAVPPDDAIESLLSMGICSNREDAMQRLQVNLIERILGLDRSLTVSQAHNFDIQRTIDAYFENPTAGPAHNEVGEPSVRRNTGPLLNPSIRF